MANAKKCDSCGAFYEPPRCNDDIRIYLDFNGYSNRYVDLCDNCYNKLCNFIKPVIPENYSVERRIINEGK